MSFEWTVEYYENIGNSEKSMNKIKDLKIQAEKDKKQMEEIKRKLIELVEPYMDKSLSEGCWIDSHSIFYKLNKTSYWRVLFTNWMEFWSDEVKILWHYDITAVLKYIEEKLWIKSLTISTMETFYIWNKLSDMKEWNKENGEFPNKPLHLYTEQEEKDLLELLLKLKK